ncbi:MAG: metallophosphoesterase [Deltaproteobacteria bacterium]
MTDWRTRLEAADNATQRLSLWDGWRQQDDLPPEAYIELAQRFFETGRQELTIEVLQRGHAVFPDDAQIAHKLGWRLRQRNDLEGAEKALQSALESQPSHIDALGVLGGIRKRQGRLDEARELYVRAHDVNADDRYPLVNLGALDAVLKRTETKEGRDWYARIEALLTEGGRTPQEDWDEICLAEAYVVQGNFEAARATIERALPHARQEVLRSSADQLEFLARHDVQPETCEHLLQQYLLPALGEVQPELGPMIVHISDLHFGKDSKDVNTHRFNERPNVRLATHLEREIRATTKDRDAIVVITGDIGYVAKKEDYKEALEQLKALMKALDLGPERVIVIPGNHDVNWALSTGAFEDRMVPYLRFVHSLYGDRAKQFYPDVPWDQRFGLGAPEELPIQLLSYHDLSVELGVVIVGINSAVEESHKHHYGFIDHRQLQRMHELFETARRPDALRIVLMHHHLLPYPDPTRFSDEDKEAKYDITVVRNGGKVEQALHKANVDIVLHGHKHAAALRESILYDRRVDAPKRMIVSGAGSTSVITKKLADGWGNHFALLDIRGRRRIANRPLVTVRWRTLAADEDHEWEDYGPPRTILG